MSCRERRATVADRDRAHARAAAERPSAHCRTWLERVARRSRFVPLALAVVGFARVAHAQTVYVDFGPVSSPVGTAPSSYGGPAVAPGRWNAVGSSSASGLVAADGAATGVGLTIDFYSAATVFGTDDSAAGEHEALLDDFLHGDSIFGAIEFSGLAAGEYRAHTVDVEHGIGFPVAIGVAGSVDPEQHLDGVWAGGYVLGAGPARAQVGNYGRHAKVVLDGTLRITVGAFGAGDPPHVRGVQLVLLDEHAVSFCAGDASAGTPCPCANAGAPGRGCASSAGPAGARLYSTGSPPGGSLVLHGEGLPESSLAIFLQGDLPLAPVVFGDGLRCAGGVLKRLFVETAEDGLVHAPGPGDTSIPARSAALGDPIAPGERRVYQVLYRDPDAAFCPAPAGSTFNATNALRVVW